MLAALRWIGAASVAMLQTLPAAGQAVPLAGTAESASICPYTFEQSTHPSLRGYRFTTPWRHTADVEEARDGWARYWAGVDDTFRLPNHQEFAIVVGEGVAGLTARWLEEALAFGDVVVPFEDDGWRGFFVTHIGTPADRVEALIRDLMRWRDDAVIDLAIANYRALGPPEIATAIATLAGTVPFLSYEEWRAGTYDDRRPYWDHDEPVAVRAARTAAAEARFPGFRMDSVFGPSYAFIDLPTGRAFDLHDGYRARWLMEAIEGGDVVVPYLTRASDAPLYWIHHSPAPPVTLRFVVFAAGLDPDEVEPALRRRLLVWERLAEEEIDAVIRTYRALAGTP